MKRLFVFIIISLILVGGFLSKAWAQGSGIEKIVVETYMPNPFLQNNIIRWVETNKPVEPCPLGASYLDNVDKKLYRCIQSGATTAWGPFVSGLNAWTSEEINDPTHPQLKYLIYPMDQDNDLMTDDIFIGVGTKTPQETLHVVGDSVLFEVNRFVISDTSSEVLFENATGQDFEIDVHNDMFKIDRTDTAWTEFLLGHSAGDIDGGLRIKSNDGNLGGGGKGTAIVLEEHSGSGDTRYELQVHDDGTGSSWGKYFSIYGGIEGSEKESLVIDRNASVFLRGTYVGAGASLELAGSGTRLMWYPGKSAFRAGTVTGSEWNNNNIGISSTALGYNTIAKGDHSIALGNKAKVGGVNSIALGQGIAVTGDNSFAVALDDEEGTIVQRDHTMSVMGGRVGIGVTEPLGALEVNDNLRITPRPGDPRTEWSDCQTGKVAYSTDNNKLYYGDNNGDWVALGGGGGEGGCYMDYTGDCRHGTNNMGSLGKWGVCTQGSGSMDTRSVFMPPGIFTGTSSDCEIIGYADMRFYEMGEAFLCCY